MRSGFPIGKIQLGGIVKTLLFRFVAAGKAPPANPQSPVCFACITGNGRIAIILMPELAHAYDFYRVARQAPLNCQRYVKVHVASVDFLLCELGYPDSRRMKCNLRLHDDNNPRAIRTLLPPSRLERHALLRSYLSFCPALVRLVHAAALHVST